jgi:RimJ/RimL family protein N-acetyltransferase
MKTIAAVINTGSNGITCRRLHAHEYDLYADFFIQRNAVSRYTYLGYTVNDHGLRDMIGKWHTPDHVILVAEDALGNIVGSIHIAQMNHTQAELGIMVAETHRQQGISGKLMDLSMLWCKNRGLTKLYMHCLSQNGPVLRIVKKYGLSVLRSGSETDSHITLQPATMLSACQEYMCRCGYNTQRWYNQLTMYLKFRR